MLSTFTIRFRSIIWFLIFAFTLSTMPHLEMLIPYRIHFFASDAYAAEEPPGTAPAEPPAGIPADPVDKEVTPAEEKPPESGDAAAAQSDETEAMETLLPATSFKVDDFTGAAHFSYPIFSPSARNGLAPKLSLEYSSSGGNGPLGVGWSISAIGFIQRRGARKGVPTYNDSTDVFEIHLGGAPQKLVLISETGVLREYRLEIEGANLRVKYYKNPQYWEVWDKAGTKMRFGYSISSRITRSQPYGTGIYRWFIDRLEDPKTNYMEILYQVPTGDQGTLYLQKIRYNGEVRGGLAPNHEIIFNLETSDRPDPIYDYRGGFRSLMKKRLASIEIKTSGVNVRKYGFEYSNPNARSVLTSITLYGGSSFEKSLPPTKFSYQAIDKGPGGSRGFAEGVEWDNPVAWGHIGGNHIRDNLYDGEYIYGTRADVMDMDGNALPDRIVRDRYAPNNWYVYLNTGSGFSNDPILWWTPVGPSLIHRLEEHGYGTKADVLDMDGNNSPDRVLSPTGVPVDPYDPWTVWLNTGDGFGSSIEWSNPSVWGDGETGYHGYYVRDTYTYGPTVVLTEVIDLNGDGWVDRVVYDKEAPCTTWTVYFGNGSNGFANATSPNWPNPSHEIWGEEACEESNYIRKDSANYYGTKCDLIDMNNDGLLDRVCFAKNFQTDRTWKVYFNTGSGFDSSVVSWPNPSAWSSTGANHLRHKKWDVIDINGDGLGDRVVYDKNYNCQTPPNCPAANWKVFFNTGAGFMGSSYEDGLDWPNPSPWSDKKGNYIRNRNEYGTYTDVFDIDGDGLVDRVVYDRDGDDGDDQTWMVYRNKGPVPDLLSEVESSIGGRIRITYRPSTDYDNRDDEGKHRLPFVVQTVHTYTQTDAPEGEVGTYSYSYEYEYAGGLYDPDTVEFRGFRYVNVCQPNCDIEGYESRTETEYLQDYYKKGKVKTQVQIAKEGHWRQVDNDWEDQDLGNGRKFSKLNWTKSTIRDCEGGVNYTDCQGGQSYIYKHRTSYQYDQAFNVSREDKEHQEGGPEEFKVDIRTYLTYTNFTEKWILSKPTEIRVMKITYEPGLTERIASRKWMDYNSDTGNLLAEEVCKSDDPATGCVNRNAVQNPVITYTYYNRGSYLGYGPLKEIIGPRTGQITSMTYELTWTHVLTTTNCLAHVTTTEYDLGTGSLKKLIPPHLQGSSYSINYTYDEFGRKKQVDRPDGGRTAWMYCPSYTGDPQCNADDRYVKKTEYIVRGNTWQASYNYALGNYCRPNIANGYFYEVTTDGGSSGSSEPTWPTVVGATVADGGLVWTCKGDIHEIKSYFDGMNRNYKTESTGPDGLAGKKIVTETHYDELGRVSDKCNPYFSTDPVACPYGTSFDYDGFGRVTRTYTPDNYTITTTNQGLTKKVTNQRGHSTWYTYDVYMRLTKVQEPNGTYTEYSYDTLGNLLEVRAAKDASGGNLLGAAITTTMTYDSLSKKRTIIDPDMGSWSYVYDKSGNLIEQRDANLANYPILFYYDCLNRLYQKVYDIPPPGQDHTVNYYYDSQVNAPPPGIPNIAKGKLWRVYDSYGGDMSEDLVVEFDKMQNVAKGRKIVGADTVNVEHTYDSAGRVLTLKYLAGHGFPTDKLYSYEYDSAGNVKYLKDNGTGANLVEYTGYTPVGQPGFATFPNPGGTPVRTTYNYYPDTTRLWTLVTQQTGGGLETFQNLDYQYDEIGNIVNLADDLNTITHVYGYDPLNRLITAQGSGPSNPYHEIYTYDVIGNIDTKTDFLGGITYDYIYTYGNKPHAVRQVKIGEQVKFDFQYDANGNMTSKTDVPAGVGWSMVYNHDNKPISITRGSTTVSFAYDGNGQRVKKENSSTIFYFGGGFEVRNGVGVIHLHAGSKRVASVRSDGKTQFYHSNHLGSASVVTNQLGARKELIEYLPFGDYRLREDYDTGFPNANYTFTGQEDDDELGFYNYGARLYDPVIGRFITPDRIVQAPENPQTLNRYSYCLNNPLIYVDPSGEWVGFFVWAVAMAAFAGGAEAHANDQPILKGAAIGAVIGAASFWAGYGVSQYLTTTVFNATEFAALSSTERIVTVAAGAFTGGAVSGGLNAAVYGGSIWKGALYSGLSAAAFVGLL